MSNEVLVIANPIEQINTELQKHEVTEESLQALVEKFKGLSVAGPEDKEGLKVLREARITLKNQRVSIEKIGKSMRDSATAFNKAVSKREKDLIAIIEPTENDLSAVEELVKAEQRAIQLEEERRAAQKFQDRLNQMHRLNCGVDALELSLMSDERYADLVISAQAEFDHQQELKAIAEREAEELRIAKEKDEAAERERMRIVAEEQAAEKARLAAERRELDLQMAENKAAAEKIAAEKRAIEEEKQREAAEKLRFQKAEAQRLITLANYRHNILWSYGHDYTAGDLALLSDSEFTAIVDVHRKQYEEHQNQLAVEKAEEERIERERLEKIEADRLEALKPDKEKLLEYVEAISYLITAGAPELATEEGREIQERASSYLRDATEFIQRELRNIYNL